MCHWAEAAGGEGAFIPCLDLGPGWRRQEAGIGGPQSKTMSQRGHQLFDQVKQSTISF